MVFLFFVKYATDNTQMVNILWWPLTPLYLGALKHMSVTHRCIKGTLSLPRKALESGQWRCGWMMTEMTTTSLSYQALPFMHWRSRLQNQEEQWRASFQHTADTFKHTEQSVPIKYGTQVKTVYLKWFTLKDWVTRLHHHTSVLPWRKVQ